MQRSHCDAFVKMLHLAEGQEIFVCSFSGRSITEIYYPHQVTCVGAAMLP